MAKNQHDPNKKHYFTQISAANTKPILESVCKDKRQIQIWPEGGNENKLEEYNFESFNADEGRIYLKSKGLLKLISKSKLTGKKIFAKFSDGENNFFTHAALEFEAEQSLYYIPTQLTIYQTVQRKDYRLDAGPFTKIKLKVSENVVLDCYDISAGGSSFCVTKEELENYPKGKEFKKCILRLNSEIFEIPKVKIMSHRDNKHNDEVKVGMAFLDIDKVLDVKLCKAINLEAKGVEIRKIMLKNDKKKKV
jgi:hypothetical protein